MRESYIGVIFRNKLEDLKPQTLKIGELNRTLLLEQESYLSLF